MKRLFITSLISIILIGCGLVTLTTSSMEASGNRENMNKIKLGMNKDQVKATMQSDPYKTEAHTVDNNEIEIWFYLTEGRKAFRRQGEDDYTPFVFKNNTLIGWGRDYYRSMLAK